MWLSVWISATRASIMHRFSHLWYNVCTVSTYDMIPRCIDYTLHPYTGIILHDTDIKGLAQDCSYSIANALQSFAKPTICCSHETNNFQERSGGQQAFVSFLLVGSPSHTILAMTVMRLIHCGERGMRWQGLQIGIRGPFWHGDYLSRNRDSHCENKVIVMAISPKEIL